MYLHTVPELAALVRDRRQALGLSQAAVAARIGTSRQWLVAFEGGQPNVELAPVLRALRLLGLRIAVTSAVATPNGAPSVAPTATGATLPISRRSRSAAGRGTTSRTPARTPSAQRAAGAASRAAATGLQPPSSGGAADGVESVLDRLRPPRPSTPRTDR